jgi:hypothetical protein
MSNSSLLDIIKPSSIEVEINLIKLRIDIEKYLTKKLSDVLDKLAQYKNKFSAEEIRAILEQIVRTQQCEFFESKRVLKVYRRAVYKNTHFV